LPSGAESSETTVQRNNLRGHNPWVISVPYFLEEQVVCSHPRQFKKTTQMRGLLKM
jgi:hypothetical protein